MKLSDGEIRSACKKRYHATPGNRASSDDKRLLSTNKQKDGEQSQQAVTFFQKVVKVSFLSQSSQVTSQVKVLLSPDAAELGRLGQIFGG